MRLKLFVYVLTAFLVSGCAATSPHNPFKIPQADIQAKVKTIALVPIDIAPEIENPAAIKFKFESLLTTKLQDGGFNVIASDEYATIWRQAVKNLGAVYDSATGKRDEKKFSAAFEYTVGELRAKTKADALLLSAIVTVKADFSSNLAEWHGASDYVRPEGVWGTFSGPQAYGTIAALSLWVDLVDVQGTEMYVNFGGIQVISKLYPGMKVIDVPRHEFFADETKNVRSVNIAINPLIGQRSPPSH